MHTVIKKYFPFFLCLLLSACGSDFSGISESPLGDNNVIVKDGGSYNPGLNGQPNICEQDAEGNCIDGNFPTETVYINNVNFDFGLSEVDNVECMTFDIPAGMVYQAEVDQAQDSDGNYSTSTDSDGLFLFAPQTSSGTPTQERTPISQGDVELCYLRTEAGTHSGSIIISFKSPAAENWQYVVSTNLRGETGEDPFWNIYAPVDGLVIDERTGFNDGVDLTEGDILVDASGNITPTYHSILKDGLDTPIKITSDTLPYEAALNRSGDFAQTIALPQTPGVYSVKFSVDSNRNTTISKTHKVIVADAPQIDILLRDTSGTAISASLPTDLQNLIVGIRVNNFEISGSQRNLELYDIYFDNTRLSNTVPMEYQDDVSWCTRDSSLPSTNTSESYTGFDGSKTFCLPLSDLTDVASGTHTITAKARNDLGEAEASFILIIDYNKPIITLENIDFSIESQSAQTFRLTGTIQNFAGHDVLQTPLVRNNDTGSYCLPNSASECEDSSFKLWFNQNPNQTPIFIYPKYDARFDGMTTHEINAEIQSNNPDHCREFEESNTHFAGESDNTEINNSQSIITTVTTINSDESETTTVYETNLDGTITIITNGSEEELFNFIDTETRTRTVHVADNGTITITIFDANNDETKVYTTDGRTGEIRESTTSLRCNIPHAEFSLTFDSSEVDLHLFSNVLELRAESVSNHRTIQPLSFFKATEKSHLPFGSGSTSTLATTMGSAQSDCESDYCVARSPLSLFIAEGIVNKNTTQGQRILKFVENILNTEMPFEDLANGPLIENEQYDIDLYYNFRKQFKAETGHQFPTEYYMLHDDYRKKFIYQGLHSSSMVSKMVALTDYRAYRVSKGTCEPGHESSCFFENEGSPLSSNLDRAFNVAVDACGETITTSFTPLHHHIYQNQIGSNIEELVYSNANWPRDLAGTNPHFNDFVSGKWIVESIDLKANGRISADLCVMPDQDRYTSCNDDVSDADLPAFWGHFTSYNLIENGLTGTPGLNDVSAPLIWSVGKIRLQLNDVIQLRKNKSGQNQLYIDKHKMDLSVKSHIDITQNKDSSVILEPFANCREYYRDLWVRERSHMGYSTEISEEQFPLGCNIDPNSRMANYPILIERNAPQATELLNSALDNPHIDNPRNDKTVAYSYVLAMVWDGVVETFGKMIGCMDTEVVNPLFKVINNRFPNKIDPPYAMYTPAEDESDEELYLTLTKIAWNDLNLDIDLAHSDLVVQDGGILARLALMASIENVNLGSPRRGEESTVAFENGPLFRNFRENKLADYPLIPESYETSSFSASADLETILNDALYLIFKKGPFTLLEALDLEELESNGSNELTLNAVVLADAFDICGDIAGNLLSTTLPVTTFFSEASSPFSTTAMSVNLILDQNNPPTVTLSPYDHGSEIQRGHAVELKIGLNNVQAGFHEFHEDNPNEFRIGDEILRLRLDAVLKIVLVYYPEERKILGFFPTQQNYHLSVVPGHNGGLYDDVKITSTLHELVSTVFSKFQKDVVFSSTSDDVGTFVLNFSGPDNVFVSDENPKMISVRSFDNLEIEFNMNEDANGECDETNRPKYVEARRRSSRSGLLSSSKGNSSDSIFNRGRRTRNRSSIIPDEEDRQPIHHENNGVYEALPPEEWAINGPDSLADECNPTWNFFYPNDFPITYALCEYGVDDVFIEPQLIFDYETGYIHMSGDLSVRLKNWLEN